jgi:hypothetical protein
MYKSYRTLFHVQHSCLICPSCTKGSYLLVTRRLNFRDRKGLITIVSKRLKNSGELKTRNFEKFYSNLQNRRLFTDPHISAVFFSFTANKVQHI